MDNQSEIVGEIKSDLKTIETKFLQLKKLVNILLDQKRLPKGGVPMFQIKHFKHEDLN